MAIKYDIPAELDKGMPKGQYSLTFEYSENPIQWVGPLGLSPLSFIMPREDMQKLINMKLIEVISGLKEEYKGQVLFKSYTVTWQNVSWGVNSLTVPKKIDFDLEVINNPILGYLLIAGVLAILVAVTPEPILAKIRKTVTGFITDIVSAPLSGFFKAIPWYVYAGVGVIIAGTLYLRYK